MALFRRSSGGKNLRNEIGSPPAFAPVSDGDKKRFARGVDCNVKILIRGDQKTGKTALWSLLQGKPIPAEYATTPEIQVANISWRYKGIEDMVKVELWDTVDKGKPRKPADLKMGLPQDMCLDAEFVDVYKGAHGVVFLIDPRRKWTFEYVQRELAKVPSALPVLILLNFRDQSGDVAVKSEDVSFYIPSVSREGKIAFAESSLTNGFGLMFVNRFFNLPYYYAQKHSLEERIASIQTKMEGAFKEIESTGVGSPEQDYKDFVSFIQREKEKASQPPAPAAGSHPSTPGGHDSDSDSNNRPSAPHTPSESRSRASSPEPGLSTSAPKDGFMAKFSKTLKRLGSSHNANAAKPHHSDVNQNLRTPNKPINDIDEFYVEDPSFDAFFSTTTTPKNSSRVTSPIRDDSDEEDNSVNPLVRGLGDLDDDLAQLAAKQASLPPKSKPVPATPKTPSSSKNTPTSTPSSSSVPKSSKHKVIESIKASQHVDDDTDSDDNPKSNPLVSRVEDDSDSDDSPMPPPSQPKKTPAPVFAPTTKPSSLPSKHVEPKKEAALILKLNDDSDDDDNAPNPFLVKKPVDDDDDDSDQDLKAARKAYMLKFQNNDSDDDKKKKHKSSKEKKSKEKEKEKEKEKHVHPPPSTSSGHQHSKMIDALESFLADEPEPEKKSKSTKSESFELDDESSHKKKKKKSKEQDEDDEGERKSKSKSKKSSKSKKEEDSPGDAYGGYEDI